MGGLNMGILKKLYAEYSEKRDIELERIVQETGKNMGHAKENLKFGLDYLDEIDGFNAKYRGNIKSGKSQELDPNKMNLNDAVKYFLDKYGIVSAKDLNPNNPKKVCHKLRDIAVDMDLYVEKVNNVNIYSRE
ncbi:hypothetical protein ACFL1H_06310 [Nanoarchaeota archaeon]